MGITADSGGVRSVERALAIVDLLGEHQALGLEELHYLTGLPKATASRMLATLQEQGWVYRASATGVIACARGGCSVTGRCASSGAWWKVLHQCCWT